MYLMIVIFCLENDVLHPIFVFMRSMIVCITIGRKSKIAFKNDVSLYNFGYKRMYV